MEVLLKSKGNRPDPSPAGIQADLLPRALCFVMGIGLLSHISSQGIIADVARQSGLCHDMFLRHGFLVSSCFIKRHIVMGCNP
jgi:hypothetical protein